MGPLHLIQGVIERDRKARLIPLDAWWALRWAEWRLRRHVR